MFCTFGPNPRKILAVPCQALTKYRAECYNLHLPKKYKTQPNLMYFGWQFVCLVFVQHALLWKCQVIMPRIMVYKGKPDNAFLSDIVPALAVAYFKSWKYGSASCELKMKTEFYNGYFGHFILYAILQMLSYFRLFMYTHKLYISCWIIWFLE